MNIHKFRDYLFDEKFSMNVLKNKIEILNYSEIGHFDSNKIIVRYSEGNIIINGKNLIISKLMDDSILIKGNINNIEFR